MTSQLMLWAAVIGLAMVCAALARQVGVLHERIAPMGALALNRRLSGGDPAPALRVPSLTGEVVTIGVISGQTGVYRPQLVFFLSPDCPVCKTLVPVLRSIRAREESWLSVILASDGGEIDAHRMFVQAHGLDAFPYVVSEVLGVTYGVSRLPYAVLIDEAGRVGGLGIVNTREHLESLFEARRLGKPSLQQYLDDGHKLTGIGR